MSLLYPCLVAFALCTVLSLAVSACFCMCFCIRAVPWHLSHRRAVVLRVAQKQGKVGQKQPTFAAVTVKDSEEVRQLPASRGYPYAHSTL